MKRIYSFFLVLIFLCPVLFVSVDAAESYVYTVDPDSEDTALFCGSVLPDGLYSIEIFVDGESPYPVTLSSVSPVSISFEYLNSSDDDSIYISYGYNQFTMSSNEDCFLLNVVSFYRLGDDICFFYFESPDEVIFDPISGGASSVSVVLTPVNSSSFLSDVVDADMMSGVLDQVVGLLPIVLGVLVAYIAIRKGISFLRNFLERS